MGEAGAGADPCRSPAAAPVLAGGGQGGGAHPREPPKSSLNGVFLWLCAGTRHEEWAGGSWHCGSDAVPVTAHGFLCSLPCQESTRGFLSRPWCSPVLLSDVLPGVPGM